MFKRNKNETALENEIQRAVFELNGHNPDSETYGNILDRVKDLHKMKEAEMQSSHVKPDTLVLAATNILGIAMIVRHEHLNVITSKALSFVQKPR